MASSERTLIARSIATGIRPEMEVLEIESESQLLESALDTRIKFVDLNGDGIPDVIAQGLVDCSPTGNCSFWIFPKTPTGYRLLLDGFGQTFTIQRSKTNGFHDIVVSMHGSATESRLTDFRFEDGHYVEVGCYYANWAVLDGNEIHELKEHQISPCRERDDSKSRRALVCSNYNSSQSFA